MKKIWMFLAVSSLAALAVGSTHFLGERDARASVSVAAPQVAAEAPVAPAVTDFAEVLSAPSLTGVPCHAPSHCCERLPNGRCLSSAQCVKPPRVCP